MFDWDAYYAQNKTALSEKRKARYQDPEVRARILEQNARSRRKRREAARVEDSKATAAIRTGNAGPAYRVRKVTIFRNGASQEIDAYTLGMVSAVLRRPIVTLHKWEKQGILPETPFRDENGFRLYTQEQIEMLAAFMDKHAKTAGTVGRRDPVAVVLPIRLADGTVVHEFCFGIGTLLAIIGRTRETWLGWERAGLVPISPLRVSSKQRRLYTLPMMEAVATALTALDGASLKSPDAKDVFKAAVFHAWEQLGVFTWTHEGSK